MRKMFTKVCILIVVVSVLQRTSQAAEPTGTFCNGKRQSPIDIYTSKLERSQLPKLVFNRAYSDRPLTQQIQSDNHSVVLTGTFRNQPAISGGPLTGSYNLHSIHFHWGTTNREGSEHLLNGIAYPLEMHVVHTKAGLTFEQAKAAESGISVIGYFIDISILGWSRKTNPFSLTTRTMETLTTPGVAKDLVRSFQMSKLVVPFSTEYITYAGSLTTGDCQEVVTWVISTKVLKITQEQMNIFRGLKPRGLVQDAQNFRSPQPLNDRKVYRVTN